MIKKILKKVIPQQLMNKIRINQIKDDTIIWGNISFGESLKKAIKRFNLDTTEVSGSLNDIKESYLLYGVTPGEYVMYNFKQLNAKKRSTFLSAKAKDEMLINYYGDVWKERFNVLKDKYVFYEKLKPFFKRDVIKVTAPEDIQLFSRFCDSHKSFIVKRIKGAGGRGTELVKVGDNSINSLFEKLLADGGFVAEELIKQHELVSEFNLSSVNTVRLPSFRHGDEIRIFSPVMRFGREGCLCDNAAQGGCFVCIDEKTGIVKTDAFDELGFQYKTHPDSQKKFLNWQVPYWNEMLGVAKEAHLSLDEEDCYVAFDMALSEKGWVIVEGNWGELFQQIALERGLREDFYLMLYNK